MQAEDRRKVLKLGYVPFKQSGPDKAAPTIQAKPTDTGSAAGVSRFAARDEDFSHATQTLYEREVARGVSENEEIFNGEEEVITPNKSRWADKYRPRKPRYFNRVQMGYEWNKYNQTHYDHDNPPPKVVQGYKFNIFYPDLIDKTKAPTYRIERENGRKRGQSFAPAGEEDTCLIRFIAGPPYEDIAFRIVDKEWDYSAKRERGFKSSFDKVRLSTRRRVSVFSGSDVVRGDADKVDRESCSFTFSSRRYLPLEPGWQTRHWSRVLTRLRFTTVNERSVRSSVLETACSANHNKAAKGRLRPCYKQRVERLPGSEEGRVRVPDIPGLW